MRKKILVSAAVVSVLLACVQWQPADAAQAKRKPAQKVTPFPDGPKLTLEKLIPLIANVPVARVLEALRKRGIDFSVTPENMTRLEEAKAAPEILDEIRKISDAQEKIAPPKPLVTGVTLLVTCVPAECEVSLDNKPSTTVKGVAHFDSLKAEVFKVTAWREGYQIAAEPIDLRSAKPGDVTRYDFKLKPTAVAQANWGDALFKAMLAKANVTRAPKQLSGVLTIKEAETVEWNVSANIAGPGAAEIEMSNAQTRVNVSCLDGGCQISGKGSWLKRSSFRGSKQEQMVQEQFLLRHTERWLANEYDSLVLRLTGVPVAATSKTDPESGQPKEFTAGTNAGAFAITLDGDSRPTSVRFTAVAGLTGSTVVTYSTYQGSYPALTEIKFTDNEKQVLSFAAKVIASSDAATKK